jgi:hypothetical protein
MAENRASGPQLGQMVTQTQTIFYPAIIVNIDSASGLVRLTAFPAGGTNDEKCVHRPNGTAWPARDALRDAYRFAFREFAAAGGLMSYGASIKAGLRGFDRDLMHGRVASSGKNE